MAVVAPPRAIALTHRVLVRQLVTRGRMIALVLIGVANVALGAAIGLNDNVDDTVEAGARLISDLGFTVLVPIVALVFATAALGDARDDGTLVYLWLRPMTRWPVVVGAWLAAITVSLPLTVIPVVASAAFFDGDVDLIIGSLLASVFGVLAYSALFILFGLLVRNAIVWGLGYILIWEGLIAALGNGPARLAIRGYTRSIITSRTGIDLELGDWGSTPSILVLAAIAVGALAIASVRLDRLDVA